MIDEWCDLDDPDGNDMEVFDWFEYYRKGHLF